MKHKLIRSFPWVFVLLFGLTTLYWCMQYRKERELVHDLIDFYVKQDSLSIITTQSLIAQNDSLKIIINRCVPLFIGEPFTRDSLNSWYTKSCGILYVDSPIRVMQNKNAVGWGNQEEGKVNVAEYSKNVRLYIDSVARKPAKVIINTNHLGEKVFTDH